MYTPIVEVDLRELVNKLKEEGGAVAKDGKDLFIGNANPMKYPHIHVWRNGTIALSESHSVNGKIGDDGIINIDALIIARERYGAYLDGPLKNAIDGILSAAS